MPPPLIKKLYERQQKTYFVGHLLHSNKAREISLTTQLVDTGEPTVYFNSIYQPGFQFISGGN